MKEKSKKIKNATFTDDAPAFHAATNDEKAENPDGANDAEKEFRAKNDDEKQNQNVDIKENFAKNLAKLRKAVGMTQAEFANEINYSDKAVSKWERAESIPDIYTLKAISVFFGVKVDALISEPRPDRLKATKNLGKKRTVLALASTTIVWLVAVLSYFFIHLIFANIRFPWLSFLYGVPISCIVLLVFTSVWGKSLGNLIIISALIWSTIACVYITLVLALPEPPKTLWEIFIVGIPAHAVTLFWFLYVKVK